MVDQASMVAAAAWAWHLVGADARKIAVVAAKEAIKKGAPIAVDALIREWKSVDWLGNQVRYKHKLGQTVSFTRILGHPKLIDLEKIYTHVFVFDKLSAVRRFSERSLLKDGAEGPYFVEDRHRFSASAVVANKRNLYILGRPGAGKTTFLKQLAIRACRDDIKETPVYVSVKDWSDSNLPLLQYIARQFEVCDFPSADGFINALLKSGRALVLLDGLDEVNEWQQKRSQIIREVVTFARQYAQNQVCLTCRIAATDYSFEDFDYVEIADFDRHQQRHFFRQWYAGSDERLNKFAREWRSKVNRPLRDLARTPLLLALLCLTFDETSTFPKRLVDLYRESTEALLRRWDGARNIVRDEFYRALPTSRKENLLETIAALFYFDSKIVFELPVLASRVRDFLLKLPGSSPVNFEDAAGVIRAIEAQHGLIVERAASLYSFSHLTLQEYFTARYIVQLQNTKTLTQVVETGMRDQKWREVLLYAASLLPDADSVLLRMARELYRLYGEDRGVLEFITLCSATVDPNIKKDIVTAAAKSSHPGLTTAEFRKVSEHISYIYEFLRARRDDPSYTSAFSVAQRAREQLRGQPNIAGKVLGGYFVNPDVFVGYLYACRLLIECLEVSVCSIRRTILSAVLNLSSETRKGIEHRFAARFDTLAPGMDRDSKTHSQHSGVRSEIPLKREVVAQVSAAGGELDERYEAEDFVGPSDADVLADLLMLIEKSEEE